MLKWHQECDWVAIGFGSFAGAVEPQPRARKVGSEGPLPDWETPNEISGQNVPANYSTKCESANPSHMMTRRLCAVTEVKNVVDQSGPAGASPTRFRPADRIERLTSEPSNARLHSNKRTSTRSVPRSAIGARRRIGAAPLAHRNSQVGATKTTDPCSEAIGRGFEIPHSTLDMFHSGHRQRRPRLRSL